MYQNFIIPYLYEAQHVLGDTPPIIRSLKPYWQPLVFHTWKVGGRCQAHCAWQRPPTTRPTTLQVWKTRGCHDGFRLLMMGGVSPETRWALYKYRIIKNFVTLLYLVGFFSRNCTMMHGSTDLTISGIHIYHSRWPSGVQVSTPDGHLHTVPYTICRINPYPANAENMVSF